MWFYAPIPADAIPRVYTDATTEGGAFKWGCEMGRSMRTVVMVLLAAGISMVAACGSDGDGPPTGPGEQPLPAFTSSLSTDTLVRAPGATSATRPLVVRVVP